jgi:hypothetical protein
MLAAIEGIDGLRAWRDVIVSLTEDAGGQGGCPLGSLAQIERSVRPLATALDVMISFTESLAPRAQQHDDLAR